MTTIESPFRNDPFHIVMQACEELWPHMPCPYIQWLPPGEIHKSDGDPWGQFICEVKEYDDDTAINIDSAIPVWGAVKVLAHEMAHAACHHLGLDGNEDHGDRWRECYGAIKERHDDINERLKKEDAE